MTTSQVKKNDFLYETAAFFCAVSGDFFGCSFAESASDEPHPNGTVWAMGVSKEDGWYDAEKNDDWSGDADDCLCYAASASNIIAWWLTGCGQRWYVASKDRDRCLESLLFTVR